jgi:maleate isomerase
MRIASLPKEPAPVRTFRAGLIVPSSNTTIEAELSDLFRLREHDRPAERFTFHSSRMRMRHVTPDELEAMNAQSDRAAAELADVSPDIVTTACLVAIMAQGPGFHRTAEQQISNALAREGVFAPVVSSAGALVAALHALGARRIAMITPYMKALTTRVAGYLEDSGIEVNDALSLEVPDNRAVARLDPADLTTHWRRLDLTGCDAVVISACVQMPSLQAIGPVERACGLPVLSAATATAWAMLRALALEPVAPEAGALLAGRLATAVES